MRSTRVSFSDQAMPPNVISPSKRQLVKKVCVVGECGDAQVLNLFQSHYQVEVVYSADGSEYLDRLDEYVFLLESFTSPAFISLFKEQGVRMMSPTYVRSRFRKHVELIAPRPNRPLYCELMKDTTLVMANMPNKSDIANMAHFLGASIRKDVIERATSVIATAVNCKQYRTAYTMGLPILRPEYVQHIWSKRDELDYDIMNAETIQQYRLQAFEGLKIAFIAFTGEEVIDMQKQVKKGGGEVVTDDRLATHVVFNAKANELPKVELQQNQIHLTSEWLWQSVQMEGCAGEENYLMRHPPTKKTSRGVFSPMTTVQQNTRQTRSSSNFLDTSNSSVLTNEYSTDDLDKVGAPSPRRVDKRHQVCMEMLETEQNYLRALDLVVKFKDALEADLAKGGEGMVTKDDIFIMFAKFGKIIQVHTEICAKLSKLVEEWKPENEVGKAWIEAEPQLVAAYPPFINSYDTLKGTLDKLDMTNQRFHVFLKAQEASPEFRRNTMRDLIIRPVQRLPSVMLLLKEIHKKTDSKLADKESLEKAERTIASVLDKANSRRAVNDEYSKMFLLCNQIEKLPAHLYKANRTHVIDLETECLGGTGLWKDHAKRTLRFFLFNDILEITKVRRLPKDPTNGTGTISRLTRQFSVSNIRNASWGGEAKPYKHVSDVLLTSLRQLYYVSAGELMLLVMTVRGETEGDEELVLVPPLDDDGGTRLFVTSLCQNVYSQCGRDIGPTKYEMHETGQAVADIVKKAMYKRGLANMSLSASMMLPTEMDDSLAPLGNATNTTFSRGGGFRSTIKRVANRIFRSSSHKSGNILQPLSGSRMSLPGGPIGNWEGESFATEADTSRRFDSFEDDSLYNEDVSELDTAMISRNGSMLEGTSSKSRQKMLNMVCRNESMPNLHGLQEKRALSNASLTISKKLHISRANLRSINEQGENSPGYLPRSGASSIASSISPDPENNHGGGRMSGVYTPTSRYGHRQTSLRSLFSFPSRSSIKRRESGKENNAVPEFRLSTQSTQV